MKKSSLYIQIFPFLKLHILVLPLIAASIFGGYHIEFLTAYLCALLHELGHIAMSYLLGVGISHIEILPFGICGRLKASVIKNPSCEIAIALSGPMVNLIIAYALYLLNGHIPIPYDMYIYLEKINISLAIINLLPCLPLDGGRILRAYLTKKIGAIRAYNISIKISLIASSLLAASSVYGLLTQSFNFSLILISAFLLGNLFQEQKNISKGVLAEMLDFKDKLSKNDFTRSSVISADKSTPARRILKRLSYDRYHIICVTDDNLKIVKTLTEGEVIKALTERGIRITLGEI